MPGDDKPKVITAYESYRPGAQETDLPGVESEMGPRPECTKIERWTREGEPYLEEYVGKGLLKGKAAIVTGGDSGIGRTVAIFFAREGCNLTINYLPEEEEDAQITKDLVEKAGQKCLLVPGDIMKDSTREEIVKKHIDAFRYIDVLVNNASKQIQCADIADIDMDNVRSTFESNIVAMIGMAKLCVPKMKRGSCIINSTSVTGWKGSQAMVDYSATKGAISTFTRSLATQLLPKGIRVNAVAPGPVLSVLQTASRSKEQMDDWGVGSVPLHGRVGQPAEIGDSYVYLATNNLSSGTVVHPNSAQFMVP